MTVNNHTIPSWQKVVVFSSRNQNDSLLFHGIFILKNARHTKKNTSAKQLNYFLLFWTFSTSNDQTLCFIKCFFIGTSGLL